MRGWYKKDVKQEQTEEMETSFFDCPLHCHSKGLNDYNAVGI